MFGNTVSVRVDITGTIPAVNAANVVNSTVAVPGIAPGDVMLPVIVTPEGLPLYVDGSCETPGQLTLAFTNFTADPYAGGDGFDLSVTIFKHTGSV